MKHFKISCQPFSIAASIEDYFYIEFRKRYIYIYIYAYIYRYIYPT